MPTGSCLCGAIKSAYTGNPNYTAICHCHDDRKMTGGQTFQIPKQNFTLLAGEPKVYTKVSDFGREINNHFCPTCGTTLYRTGGAPNVADMVGLKTAVLDDQTVLEETPPQMEVFVERRPKWVSRVEGAVQLSSKYEVVG